MANSIDKTRKVKAVALDFDGVITNLDIDWNAAIRQASEIAGYDVKSLLLFYENCFGTPFFQIVSSEMEKIELEAIRRSQVLPFVKESLQKLSEKQVEVYIVSMQSFRVVKEFLDQHGLTSFFKDIITRERAPSKKAQIECLLKETGNIPNQIMLIDDSKRNINTCNELGVICFHFQRKQNPSEAMETWDKILNLL
jgi:phosphoglycolate phosphatase-like HAD superfamily hydrolase